MTPVPLIDVLRSVIGESLRVELIRVMEDWSRPKYYYPSENVELMAETFPLFNLIYIGELLMNDELEMLK